MTSASSAVDSSAVMIAAGERAVTISYPSSLRRSRSASMTSGWSSATRTREERGSGMGSPGSEETACRMLRTETLPLVSQRHHRIHRRRLARGQVAAEQRRGAEHEGDDDEGDRIGGARAVEQRRQTARHRQGAGEADRDTETDEGERIAEHVADDVASLGAERDA